MESNEEPIMLKNPDISFSSLPYLKENLEETKINLFKINLKKDIIIYQYSFLFEPEINHNEGLIKNIIKSFDFIYGDLFVIDKNYFYSTKEVNYNMTIRKRLKNLGNILIHINYSNCIKLNNENLYMEKISKQVIEMLIYDILKSNQNLELEKNIYFDRNNSQYFLNNMIYFNTGNLFKFVAIKNECFLNISFIKKIYSNYSISDYFENNKHKHSSQIKNNLVGKYFAVKNINLDTNKKFKINYIDENNFYQNNYTYYNIIGTNNNIERVFPIDICYLDKHIISDTTSKEIIKNDFFKYIKQENNINGFIDFLTNYKLSNKKYKKYGIEILPINKIIKSYFIKSPLSTNIQSNKNNSQMTEINDWLFIYQKHNYNQAEQLYNNFLYYSQQLNIKLNKPDRFELYDQSNLSVYWIETIEDYFKKKNYQFVLFLIDKNNDLYNALKKHSFIHKGYISQIVRITTLKKSPNIIAKNILIQINAKINGVLNKIQFDKKILDLNLMIIGIDSYQSKKKSIFSMVATMDCNFSQFYNKGKFIDRKQFTNENDKIIIDSGEKFNIISDFIEEAIKEYYNKNKKFPGGIIIYRKEKIFKENNKFIKREVKDIELRLNGKVSESILSKEKKIIPYYYILMNKNSTYQLSERQKKNIDNSITNKNYFEFYLHTEENFPLTFYRVLYGNMKCDEIIPKLTFDLCHNYPNWNGPIKIPNVMMAAEKLTKIDNEYSNNLNKKLSFGQCYL